MTLKKMTLKNMSPDKKLVLGGIAAAICVTVLVAFFAPANEANDPRPTVDNAAPMGVKAAFVLLGHLGYKVQHTRDPLTGLDAVDAEHTSLVLANPWAHFDKPSQTALLQYLQRGGHVLAAGSYGAAMLPGLYWRDDSKTPDRCLSQPEGTSALAQAGPVIFHPSILAKDDLVETVVAHSCKEGGAAVVFYTYGKGSVVWWASQEPLTNRGLHEDNNLRLLMASLGGKDRTILFEESNAEALPHSIWDTAKGLPITALSLQLLLVLVFLVLSYGRRHGPLRTLATTPRTSPLEFAHSMGNLYHKAGAGEAAIANARLRLIHMLEQQCGVSHEAVREGATAIAASLRERFGFEDADLVSLLEATESLKRTSPAKALDVVRRLNQAMDALQQRVSTKPHSIEENLIVRT